MKKQRRTRIKWAPYLLIMPSLIYLALFFAWPMLRGLTLAFREDGVLLNVLAEANANSSLTGQFPRGAQVQIVSQQANRIEPGDLGQANLQTEVWYQIRAQGQDGQPLQGWSPERRIRVLESDADGNPVSGSVRVVLSSTADPLTSVHAEPDQGSPVIGQLEARVPVEIIGQETLELWYLLRGEVDGQPVEGWSQARYIQTLGGASQGRVNQGNAGQFTTRFFERMLADRFFWPALRTTLLLVVLIIPAQFVLALIMALVIQANLKGGGFFLYVFSVALGISDLAVGIVWYAIFTQTGYLNSILQSLGLISAPITYLSANSRQWILVAIWLAEVWRATAIVMVILVAGLQSISREVLEAGEVFGASLWQRVRFIILPLLRPSIQVALILRTILALQVFALVIVLGGGDIVTVLANETYRQYYELRNFNMAAAYASFILFLSVFIAFLYLRAVRTQEDMQ